MESEFICDLIHQLRDIRSQIVRNHDLDHDNAGVRELRLATARLMSLLILRAKYGDDGPPGRLTGSQMDSISHPLQFPK